MYIRDSVHWCIFIWWLERLAYLIYSIRTFVSLPLSSQNLHLYHLDEFHWHIFTCIHAFFISLPPTPPCYIIHSLIAILSSRIWSLHLSLSLAYAYSYEIQKNTVFLIDTYTIYKAVGSCNKHDLENNLWESIISYKPNVWLWLGRKWSLCTHTCIHSDTYIHKSYTHIHIYIYTHLHT